MDEKIAQAKQQSIKNIKKLRNMSDMSISELMEKLGEKSLTKYYRWLGGGTISDSDVIKLSEIFNVSTDCILGLKPLQITE